MRRSCGSCTRSGAPASQGLGWSCARAGLGWRVCTRYKAVQVLLAEWVRGQVLLWPEQCLLGWPCNAALPPRRCWPGPDTGVGRTKEPAESEGLVGMPHSQLLLISGRANWYAISLSALPTPLECWLLAGA